MKFYVDELPKSCCWTDCPFNYDTISCRAIRYSMSEKEYDRFEDSDEFDRLKEYLGCRFTDDNRQRYPNCPLRLYKENSNE